MGILPTSSILVGRRGLAAPILSENIYCRAAKAAKGRGGEEGIGQTGATPKARQNVPLGFKSVKSLSTDVEKK